jgi:hypothetical protein
VRHSATCNWRQVQKLERRQFMNYRRSVILLA